MRLWPDESDKPWARGVAACGYQVLCVSQFTLCAQMKGAKPKPSFHRSMPPGEAKPFYEGFLELLHEEYATAAGCEVAQLRSTAEDGEWEARIQDGRFGEMMVVSLENDGPVTICDEV